jgi:hypothetical protein
MRLPKNNPAKSPRLSKKRLASAGILVVLVAFAPVAVEGLLQLPPEMNRIPDANQQNAINQQQEKKVSFDAANAERKKQMAEDSAALVKLATDLKTEVDKTTKDTLSLSVIRKADAIEKLAHNVKEKMKP